MTIQTHEVVVLHPSDAARIRARCGACAATVTMVTPEEASRLAHVSVRTLYRWVEEEKVHFLESPAGQLLVCMDSLPRRRM